MLLVLLTAPDDAGRPSFGLPPDLRMLVRPASLFIVNGMVAGLTLWALARRARAAPPFWRDVF
jgi:hypothetical protein